jgi:hypothetical protein
VIEFELDGTIIRRRQRVVLVVDDEPVIRQ